MLRIANIPSLTDDDNLEASLIAWLMEGDPSIRWQVRADLLDANQEVVANERRSVAETGWGAQLLGMQEPSGRWGGGIYSPKWISTTYTLLALRFLGLAQDNLQAHMGCELLLERGFYKDGGINYFSSMKLSEACVTGMVLSILAYFRHPDDRIHELVAHLLGRQMADGGWNCQDHHGATHSSFHTTLSVLEGMLEYQLLCDVQQTPEVLLAQQRAHSFLLEHRLFRSHRTGKIFDPRMLRFPFPPRWHYDVLRALDYFQKYFRYLSEVEEANTKLRKSEKRLPKSGMQAAQIAPGTVFGAEDGTRGDHINKADKGNAEGEKDPRFEDAISLIQKKRKADGRWPAYQGPKGRVFFEMEAAGEPGRWNTLRALRVLRWWEEGS